MTVTSNRVERSTKQRTTTTKAATSAKYVTKVDLNNLPKGMSPKLAEKVRGMGLTTDPALQPKNGVTHCNQAADKYAREFGYKGLEGKNGAPMMANDMYAKMNAPGSGWKKVSAQGAIDAAKDGKMVFASVQGHPHGHIAAVTGEWAPGVPGVSQAGSPPNFEFGKWRREAPTYFVKE